MSQLQAQVSSTSDHTQPPERLLTTSPFFPPQEATNYGTQSSTDTGQVLYNGGQHSTPYATEAHTRTWKPIEPEIIYSLPMPPKRNLPFHKRGEANQIRCSSASDIPALPKPTPTPVTRSNSTVEPKQVASTKTPVPTSKPPKKRVAQRKAPLSTKLVQEVADTQEPITNIVKEQPISGTIIAQDEPSPLAAKSATAVRPASAASRLQSKATVTKKRPAAAVPIRPSSVAKRPKMVDQGTQTQTLSGRDHTIAANSTTSTEISGHVHREASLSPPPESYLKLLDTFVTKYKARPAPKELWEAPGYAEADEDERQNLLNTFICDNLENPEFLQLCQDTERSWRKIGLGI